MAEFALTLTLLAGVGQLPTSVGWRRSTLGDGRATTHRATVAESRADLKRPDARSGVESHGSLSEDATQGDVPVGVEV